jgi:hypothetical protein
LAVAVGVSLATLGCTRAGSTNVRKAESSSLCAQRVLIALEKLNDPGVPLLVGALDEEATKRGLEATVIESPAVHNPRHPTVAEPLLQYAPEALLIINVWESTTHIQDFIPTRTEIRFGVHLYEYTPERNLIEVWKAELSSSRPLTGSHTITVEQARIIAEELLDELVQSKLVWPCK